MKHARIWLDVFVFMTVNSDYDKNPQLFSCSVFLVLHNILFVQALKIIEVHLELRDQTPFVFFINIKLEYWQLNHIQ